VIPVFTARSDSPSVKLTAQEKTLMSDVSSRRRLRCLRLVVPGLMIFAALSLWTTAINLTLPLLLQLGVAVIVFGIALLATFTDHTQVASNIVIAGSLLAVFLIIVNDVLITGKLEIRTITLMYLLLFPIVLAGVLSEPQTVLITAGLGIIFSLGLFLWRVPSADVIQLLQQRGNVILLVLPVLAQLGIGFITYAGTSSFRRMQDELAEYHVAFRREKELEQLREQFISSINHELRTPIMAVQGYLGLAQELGQRQDYTAQSHMLTRGQEVAENLAQLVKSMLNIRRIRSQGAPVELDPIPLEPLIDHVQHLSHLFNTALEQHRINVQIQENLTVLANEELLQEVLTNLLSNAIKYSPAGSTITIRAMAVLPAKTSRQRESTIAEITVQDQGLGIAPDQAPLIFEPFVRLHRDELAHTIGSGLGLAICRAHIEAMNGRIWVESTGIQGEGSTFHVTLPLLF